MEVGKKHEKTLRFLEGLWYRWGQTLIYDCAKLYNLTDEQRDALETVLLKPNDWIVEVSLPLSLKET